MWELNGYHLAEHGIIENDYVQGSPDFNLPYDESNSKYPEMDMERIDEAYLRGRGNFWIARLDNQPVGYVGAQDKGDFVELRRMYVRIEYRRRGIGTLLVQALLKHCKGQEVCIVKLWTAEKGPGRFLYEKLDFRQVELVDDELDNKYGSRDEIRMCLELM